MSNTSRNNWGLGLHVSEHVSNIFSKYLSYKLDIKRLNADMNKIKEEAKIRNKMVDDAFKLRMQDIKERRKILDAAHRTIQKDLNNQHIERITYSKVIEGLSSGLTDKELDVEEKKVIRETIKELSNLSIEVGKRGTENLSILADITNQAIKSLPDINQILKLNTGE